MQTFLQAYLRLAATKMHVRLQYGRIYCQYGTAVLVLVTCLLRFLHRGFYNQI